jgi:hypothetical protein
MTIRPAALALLVALGAVYPSMAGELDGTYVLDLEDSDSIAEVLTRAGAPKFVGKMADRTKVTVVVAEADGQVTLQFKTKVYKHTEVMVPDGETREHSGHHGNRKVTHRWDDRGGLEARTDKELDDGESQVMLCTYRLADDGDTLREEYVLTTADGTELQATRLYRRL